MSRLLIIIMMLLTTSCAKSYVVQVGTTPVTIQQTSNGKGKSFVHVHQNETTALQAAQHVVHAEGGSLLTLKHPGGQRNIVFYMHDTRYEFDPNRMFTDVGIQKTLKMYGHYSMAAYIAVKKLADKVKLLLPPGKIIAVHNNNDYSIKAYFPGKGLYKDAKQLNLEHQRFYRNFYLVTRPNDFVRLKDLRYNTVLQADTATDDGSLSVYLANRHYVNVEAGYGQLADQIDMLKWA